ncbi:MAG: hypothetical protein R2709_14800 [Marmoricola sp.]
MRAPPSSMRSTANARLWQRVIAHLRIRRSQQERVRRGVEQPQWLRRVTYAARRCCSCPLGFVVAAVVVGTTPA